MTNYQEQFLNYNQPSSWPFYNVINTHLDDDQILSYVDPSGADFSSTFNLPPSDDMDDDIITAGSSFHQFSSLLTDDNLTLSPASDDGLGMMITLSTDELLMGLDRLDPDFSDSEGCNTTVQQQQQQQQQQDFSTQKGNNDWSPSPSNDEISPMDVAISISPMDVPISNPPLNIPGEDSELENDISVFHLLKAYGESMGGGHKELAEVIMASVSEKVSPAGDSLERLAFNLSQDLRKEVDYIKQEAVKNYEAAFRAFYQIFPYGRFAHFAANSAMVESIPSDTDAIHIVDFDIGEGVQWPPVIEALARLRNVKTVKLTAVTNWGETESDVEDCDWAPAMWNFQEVKRRLLEHSGRLGLKLEIQGIRIDSVASEIAKRKKKSRGSEWCVFNCMVGLPHMRRVKSRRVVEEFLGIAHESITESGGIVSRGEGEAWESLKGCSGFGSFFEGNMVYYKSLLESIELNFPELAEARMALECLFVAPFISAEAWFQRWSEMVESKGVLEKAESWKVSKESLEEAKEMVKERQTLYGVRIGGEEENEMVLEWKGTPLVRVSSAWRRN